MHKVTANVSELADLLDTYEAWCVVEGKARFGEESETEGWSRPWEAPFVERGAPLAAEALAPLTSTFGELDGDYTKIITELGPFAFRSGSYGLLRVLPPDEAAHLHELVQSEMDFHDGLREEILEEDGLDFAKLIPVMTGESRDGMWGLWDTSSESGRIVYWDTDQAGDLEWTFPNLASFIASLLATARDPACEPPRLT